MSGVTIEREQPAPDLGAEAYDLFLTEKSTTGRSSRVEIAVRTANAVVTLSFSGADLRIDPDLPRGLQLVTSPVAEKRLRPTAEALLPGVLALLD
jgi:hypothetical protein